MHVCAWAVLSGVLLCVPAGSWPRLPTRCLRAVIVKLGVTVFITKKEFSSVITRRRHQNIQGNEQIQSVRGGNAMAEPCMYADVFILSGGHASSGNASYLCDYFAMFKNFQAILPRLSAKFGIYSITEQPLNSMFWKYPLMSVSCLHEYIYLWWMFPLLLV